MATRNREAPRKRGSRRIRRLRHTLGRIGRPALRPTAGGAAALLLSVALLVAGASVLSTELVAAALACALALACGLASVALALARSRSKARATNATGSSGWRRAAARALDLFAARAVERTSTWVRIDQRGRVKETLTGIGSPTARGLYRAGGDRVAFSDPLGFWLARATEPSHRELWIAPAPPARAHRALEALARRAAPYAVVDDTARMASLVRPYEQGDPLRAVAWRQSAHHGRLMSFDPDRARPVVPLVAVDTLEATDADALAAEALGACLLIARQTGARGDIALTDGVSRASGPHRIERFCAALDADGAAAVDAEAARRARAIARQAALGLGARSRRPIVLVANRADTKLAQHLDGLVDAHLTVVIARDAEGIAPAPAVADEAHGDSPHPPAGGRARHAARDRGEAPLPVTLASAACCAIEVLLSLQLLFTMIEPASWSRFACISLPAVAAGAALAEGLLRPRRRAVRALVDTLALALVGIASVAFAVRSIAASSGIDVLDSASDLSALGIDGAGGGLSWIPPVVARGLHELYFGQWVPVTVSPVSDAALALFMLPAAVAIQLLCGARRARPLMAALPLAAAAARAVFMGAANGTATIAAILFFGLALRALGQVPRIAPPEGGTGAEARARRPRTRIAARALCALRPLACAVCLVLALAACALAPAATRAAGALPIRLDVQSNVLSGNTVNPIMDLRHDLSRSGETVALTYRTGLNRPLYLGLATLSDLDGAVWALDDTQVGNAAGPLSFLFPRGPDIAPHALPGTSTADDLVTTLFRDGGMQAVGDIRSTAASIVIDGLASRFAPIPVGAYATTVPRDSQAEGWRWSDTGTVYNENATTNRGLAYTVEAAYIAPVTNAEEMRTLARDLETALWSRLWSSGTVATAEDRRALDERADALIDEGREAVDARYLELPEDLPASIGDIAQDLHVQEGREDSGAESLSHEIDQLEQLIAYFSDSRFTYTLDVADAGDNLEATARFLETGEGYCAHYASAFAVLGRALGIPTRIALGYRASTAQDGEGRYVVTNRDLHAWAEAYLYGIGWIPFDMTPASAQAAGATGAAETPDKTPDKTDEPAQTPEDTENPAEQQAPDPAEGTGRDPAGPTDAANQDPLAAARELAARIGETAARALPYAAAPIAIALAACAPRIFRALRRTWRLRAVDRADRSPARAIEAAWAEAEDLTRRRGATWGRGATEEDIARAMAEAVPQASEATTRLGALVCQVRYGAAAPRIAAGELRSLLGALDEPARRRR